MCTEAVNTFLPFMNLNKFHTLLKSTEIRIFHFDFSEIIYRYFALFWGKT